MTFNELQKLLMNETKELLKNMTFLDSNGRDTEIFGYPQAADFNGLPGQDLLLQGKEVILPYFLVRLDRVEYRKKDADDKNLGSVVLEINICRSQKDGFYLLTAAIERITHRFLTDPFLQSFWCERAINISFPQKVTPSYFTGEIEMFWNMPELESGGIL